MYWEDVFLYCGNGFIESGCDAVLLLFGDGEVSVSQAAAPFCCLEHNAAESDVYLVVIVLACEDAPGERPGADGVFDVVAASAGHKYWLVEGKEVVDDFDVEVVCEAEVCERVASECVGTKLEDDDVRLECMDEWQDEGLDGVQICLIVSADRQGGVDAVALSLSCADFVGKAGSRK